MDKETNNILAAIMIDKRVNKILEADASSQSWASVNKSKLPVSSFLWVEDPKKKSTWHLPYKDANGVVNMNALRAIAAAVAGARTGKPMNLPAAIRTKIKNLLKKYKIGQQNKTEGRRMKVKFRNFTESIFSNATLKHDAENCIVYGMSILKNESKNCSYKEGKGRKYTDRAMLSTAKLIEGAKSYINHATREELANRGGIRDIRDLLGYFENGRIDGNIVRADLHYLQSHKNWFGPIVDQMADKVGGSIHAYGPSVFNESTKYETVEDIKVLSSTDIVTEPGSTNNLFESIRRDNENDMDYTTITLADLKENRPDLVTEVLKGHKEDVKTAKIIEEKDNKIAELDKENKSLKEQVDKYEVRDALAKKEKMISEKLEKSELPKEAVTDVFKKQLMEAKDEAAINELIEDRKSFIKENKLVKGMGGESKLGEDKFNLKESMKDYSKAIEGVEIK